MADKRTTPNGTPKPHRSGRGTTSTAVAGYVEFVTEGNKGPRPIGQMASKLVAQIIIYGGQFILRGLAEAYRQALVNAQASGAAAGAARQGTTGSTAVRRGLMSVDEACKILGVSRDSGLETIAKQFKRIYDQNDPKNGGSLYVQAKVYNARRSLEQELGQSLEVEKSDFTERDSQRGL